ncbi:MOSC domain-containing protein YiiM [Friedmanniella luteola]|uniref:MOSC domain-containing protein YiiM n=1 Tax=Friedmanniella luteola TaxID=546871 RepID=A0A1H1Z2H0_9ACTN|nr:MOSC domain-containing protein [Friedmanniella luteola]SDT27752.1 MOSC domain-containing protein YiiM [Friedmanniella luteola]
MGHILSVNVGRAEPNPYKSARSTGIGKRPVTGPVELRAPGAKRGGLGSGLVGDFIGDTRHHGGDLQAVYAFQREDLDAWEARLGRALPDGSFGENLTTTGMDVNEARVGEVWQIGDTAQLRVTSPRIPCATFRGWMGERAWAKTFVEAGRPGTYLSVVVPGTVAAGDRVEVVHRPDHDVTAALVFRATTTERDLLPSLLAAGDDLEPEIAEAARERRLVVLD